MDYAVKDYSVCLKINPNYYPALINRGIVQGYLNNYVEAITDLNKAIKLNPEHPIGYLNRAVIYIMIDKKNLACENISQAKKKDLKEEFKDDITELETENCQ